MDLALTIMIILLIIFRPRPAGVRYYILLVLGILFFVISLLFAPILLLSPIFYMGVTIFIVLGLYAAFIRKKKDNSQ